MKVELLSAEKGKTVTFEEVLLFSDDKKLEVGKPFLKNVTVSAKVLENKRDKKVLIFKKRRRHNSRRLNGHRQSISVVQISNIALDGKPILTEQKKDSSDGKKKVDQKPVKKKIKKDSKNGS